MIIFWRLILAHLLADFTFQSNSIALWKRKNVWGGIIHSLIFIVSGLALCFPYLNEIWISIDGLHFQGWFCLLLLGVFHFIEDEWRVYSIGRGSPDNLLFFLFDQIIHLSFIFILAPQMIFDHSGLILPEKIIFLSIMFVLVTHFTTVFVYYIERIFRRPQEIDSFSHGKYYFMAERIVLAGSFLLPGWWWLGFILLWLLRLGLFYWKKEYDFSWGDLIVGNIFAIIFGGIIKVFF
ncbi:MAG: DUF3307 domain-containing protein [Elusimicrobiota bacterium]